MPTPEEVLNDPQFHKLPFSERIKVFDQIDPAFVNLPPSEKAKVIGTLSKPKKQTGLSGQFEPRQGVSTLTGQPIDVNRPSTLPPTQRIQAEGQGQLRGLTPEQTVSVFARPTLETAGLFAGGTAGAPTGPVGGVAGAGLGYAAGGQLADLLDRALGVKFPAPLTEPEQPTQEPTIGNELAKTLGRTVEGAGIEAGGQVIGRAVQKATPVVKSILKTRKRTAAETAGKILERGGGYLDAETAGIRAQTAGRTREEAFTEAKNAAYNRVGETITEGVSHPTAALSQAANELVSGQGRVTNATVSAKAKKLLNPDSLTWKQMQSERAELGRLAETAKARGDKASAFAFKKLQKAIDSDMATFSDTIGGQTKEAFDAANKIFAEGTGELPGAGVFRSKEARNIIQSTSPSTLAKSYLKSSTPVEKIRLLKNVVGDEGVEPLKQAWLTDLFSKGPDGTFSPIGFSKELDKYSVQQLSAFMNKEEIQGLKAFAKLSRTVPEGGLFTPRFYYTGGRAKLAAGLGGGEILNRLPVIGQARFATEYFRNKDLQNLIKIVTDTKSTAGMKSEAVSKVLAIFGQDENAPAREAVGQGVDQGLNQLKGAVLSLPAVGSIYNKLRGGEQQ